MIMSNAISIRKRKELQTSRFDTRTDRISPQLGSTKKMANEIQRLQLIKHSQWIQRMKFTLGHRRSMAKRKQTTWTLQTCRTCA